MINIRKILLLLFLLYGSTLAHSSSLHWCPEPMVIKNELNNNTVYNLCYGKDGFMWLATDRGISRYDGFRFRDYPLILRTDSLSIPLTQAVGALKENSDGLFYARLYQGGIVCFDKEKEKYLPFCFDRSFKLRDVLDFCWSGGVLYLATSYGLFRVDVVRKEGDKGEFIFCTLGAEPLVKGKVTNLCVDGKTNRNYILYCTNDCV